MDSSGADNRPHYTTPISRLVREDCEALIRLALDEDAPGGDATSDPIFPEDREGRGRIVSREGGVVCGLRLTDFLLEIDAERTSTRLQAETRKADGDTFAPGDELIAFTGPLRTLLRLERPILNFMQYLSGISTTVAAAVEKAGGDIAVLDTRKTLPGWRRLSKYAVYCGGGTNHRIHLSDMAMIKDNHIAAAGGIKAAADKIHSAHPDLPLEIEVDTLEQIPEALECRPRVLLLDNMDRKTIDAAFELIEKLPPEQRPFMEASGGWTPDDLKQLEGLQGVGVSMGYLTHTTRFLDLSMEIV